MHENVTVSQICWEMTIFSVDEPNLDSASFAVVILGAAGTLGVVSGVVRGGIIIIIRGIVSGLPWPWHCFGSLVLLSGVGHVMSASC
jgi:hypothetical protein